jgi:hypothetical protein
MSTVEGPGTTPIIDDAACLHKRFGSEPANEPESVVMRGGHLDFLSQPVEFADALLRRVPAPGYTRPAGSIAPRPTRPQGAG